MEYESLKPILKTTALLSSLYILSGCAFSSRVRKIIQERDHHECKLADQNCSGQLEAAHIDHNKRNRNYTKPSNGRLLCVYHHLYDHINRHGRNGLTEKQNQWAINAIKGRLKDP